MSSQERPQIYGLISKVMKEIGAVAKDSKNEQQGYSFRGIEAFYNSAHPALTNHGVFCAPQLLKTESQDRVTANGKPAIRVTVEVSHKFYAPDGSFVDVITPGEGIDTSDKATNKAMSAAMKYAFIELFSVPTKDVEDSDRDNPEVGMRPSKAVERIEKDIPLDGTILPPADQLVTPEQATKLHTRFRDELREQLKPEADKYLADFLGSKLYPSAKAIPKTEFATVGKQAMEFAKTL